MDASRFPITTPYGQVPGYELNNGWHRGEDRAMPMDTPVLVNGHEIGLSGNSGYVTGPHLHIGRFVGGSDTPPNGGGFHFSQATVTEIGEDATNGKFVRVQADGASWVYLHLSRQTVAVGQDLVATAPPTPASYAITESYPEGKQIRLNKDTNLWGMNYHFDFMVAHPVETGHKQGEIWTVTNKVHHEDGYDYYRRDGQVDGFNVLDCDDYTPPPPPPYIPPAAPLKAIPVETYPLDWEVPTFATDKDATLKRNATGVLKPNQNYKVYDRQGLAYNLTLDYPKPGAWINIEHNVPPAPPNPEPLPQRVIDVIQNAAKEMPKLREAPEVEKPKLHYDWLRGDRKPVYFHTLNATPQRFKDLENPDTTVQAILPANKDILFSMITIKGGVDYYIPTTSLQNGNRHGIPETMLKEVGVTLPKPTKRLDRNKDGRINIEDITDLMDDFGNKYFKPGLAAATKVLKTGKPQRFVDGFSKAIKKDKV